MQKLVKRILFQIQLLKMNRFYLTIKKLRCCAYIALLFIGREGDLALDIVRYLLQGEFIF